MADQDLAKLKITKSPIVTQTFSRKRIYYGAGALIFIVLLTLLYFKGFLSPAVEVETAAVSMVYPSQSFTLLNASGYVVAQRKAAVASKVTGRLISLSVEEGSRVKKGEIIARLESEDMKAALNQAAANLNQTQAELHEATLNYNRFKDLLTQGAASRSDYDAAEARYKRAAAAVNAGNAALQGARVAVEYTLIRAPFDAVVLTKNADIGDIVTPLGAAANAKAAVVTIADMDSLQIEVDVAESNVGLVKPEQPCEILLDSLPQSRFPGAVHMIVPTADRTKASVMVKVKFLDKDPRILPEMSAKVAFLDRAVTAEEEKPFTALNPATVVGKNSKKAVFLINGERAAETPVTLGEQRGDWIEVINGVKAGDKLVLKPPKKLRNGMKIKYEGK